MTRFEFADRMPISGTRRTADGYLVAEARVAKGGNIQEYFGFEIGHADASKVFKVYRPEDEVFKGDTLKTFAHRPVTMGHPPEGVTADNWRQTAVGNTGSEVIRDGEFVRVPLAVMDAQAIADIEKGVREFSMGYDCELVMQPGKTTDGREYDAFQRNHRMNHVAIVEVGRAGPECRFGDRSLVRTPQQQKDAENMKTVTIDGKAFEVTDEVAAALTKAQADVKGTLDAVNPVLDAAHERVRTLTADKATADAAIAAKDAEIAELKKAIPTADQLHAMAAELSAVVDAAKRLAPDLDVKGKTADAIKLAAVTAKIGDDAVKGKSADYIAATFDHLSQTNDADPVANAIANISKTSDAGKGFATYLDNISNAWKQ